MTNINFVKNNIKNELIFNMTKIINVIFDMEKIMFDNWTLKIIVMLYAQTQIRVDPPQLRLLNRRGSRRTRFNTLKI